MKRDDWKVWRVEFYRNISPVAIISVIVQNATALWGLLGLGSTLEKRSGVALWGVGGTKLKL